jgi:hypothetical protein
MKRAAACSDRPRKAARMSAPSCRIETRVTPAAWRACCPWESWPVLWQHRPSCPPFPPCRVVACASHGVRGLAVCSYACAAKVDLHGKRSTSLQCHGQLGSTAIRPTASQGPLPTKVHCQLPINVRHNCGPAATRQVPSNFPSASLRYHQGNVRAVLSVFMPSVEVDYDDAPKPHCQAAAAAQGSPKAYC